VGTDLSPNAALSLLNIMMVTLLTLSPEDKVFNPVSCQTNDYKCYLLFTDLRHRNKKLIYDIIMYIVGI
jgi:hypothetical protein